MSLLRLLKPFFPAALHPHRWLEARTIPPGPRQVLHGPFAGMLYGEKSICSAFYPKILGTYEKELFGVLNELSRLQPKTIIDVGAAEGYYACGLAKLFPQAEVIACEADIVGRYHLSHTIEINGLNDRVHVEGSCDAKLLTQLLTASNGSTLLVADCEGWEYELLDPATVPLLGQCHILVECHDFILPGLTDILLKRFGSTHDIQDIPYQGRTRRDMPGYSNTLYERIIPEKYYQMFVDEGRPASMHWLWMRARKSA